ncbi:protein translocase SEC61 complex subunit gamma [Candidatus Woesearchaeota archaeon]|nr:protein translocase SEC61 complex subunit gamma [Candidatus Woesearchaeota archaeon]
MTENLPLQVKIQHFFKEYYRVLRLTKKPTKNEYKSIVKVSGIGILVIGMIGFIISITKQLLF